MKPEHVLYPQGIFKFKTLEDANAHREAIELEHARQQRATRKKTHNARD